MKTKSLFYVLLLISMKIYSQDLVQISAGPLYGPEAYVAGFKMEMTSAEEGFYYGGYVIGGFIPVSGAVGALIGYDWGFGIVENAFTLTGWSTERVGYTNKVGYFSLNPKIGLYLPFKIFNNELSQKLIFSVGPSFFYPKEWDNDGINLFYAGTLWNFEIKFSYVSKGNKNEE